MGPPCADGYLRHRPEESVLYQVVEAHWPGFRQRADEAGCLPRFVVREFEEDLRCGILEHGLARLSCRRCDIQGIGTHELLHTVGVPHLGDDVNATMYPSVSRTDDIKLRSLEPLDIDALLQRYPPPAG